MDIAHALEQELEQAKRQVVEHFTVAGTLLEAWASAKSFQPKNGKNAPTG